MAGPRSLLGFWIGGAAGALPGGGGARSMLAFWMGGVSGSGGGPTPGPSILMVEVYFIRNVGRLMGRG